MRFRGMSGCVVVCLVGLATQEVGWGVGRAATIYNDGQPHTLSTALVDVQVSNNTPITVVAGAVLTSSPGQTALSAQGSDLTITGGTITGAVGGFGLTFSGGGHALNISGGTITGGTSRESAVIVLIGGTPTASTISGGSFTAGPLIVFTLGVDITGGNSLTISGGTFEPVIGGIAVMDALLSSGGRLTFLGSNLTYDGSRITGTLADGHAILMRLSLGFSPTITTFSSTNITFTGNAVLATPEPSSVLMLGIGLAGVGVAGWRNRRQFVARTHSMS